MHARYARLCPISREIPRNFRHISLISAQTGGEGMSALLSSAFPLTALQQQIILNPTLRIDTGFEHTPNPRP
jgi:hypothetical protein